jgi:hypothetical protein
MPKARFTGREVGREGENQKYGRKEAKI